MNNKELVSALASALNIPRQQAASQLQSFVSSLSSSFSLEAEVAFAQFGTFEVREKSQRVMVNPKTRRQILIPPKLSLSFRPSSTFKNKIKDSSVD